MSTTADALANSQRRFHALDLSRPELEVGLDPETTLVELDLAAAETDGTLAAVGATYSPDDDRIDDTIHRPGVRLVNFAGVLKHGGFPLASLIRDLLDAVHEAMGTPAEIEFAVSLGESDELAEMAVLQLRPMMAGGQRQDVDLGRLDGRRRLIAGPALGNGVIEGLGDAIYVHPGRFDAGDTPRLAAAVGRINERLSRQKRPYLLIGPGRWGTADRFLGIPVEWQQVSAARVIVEICGEGGVEPSHGTHFFHNITALRVGYFCVAPGGDGQEVDFDWLDALPAEDEIDGVRHVRLPEPATAWIDGRKAVGVVLRGAG